MNDTRTPLRYRVAHYRPGTDVEILAKGEIQNDAHAEWARNTRDISMDWLHDMDYLRFEYEQAEITGLPEVALEFQYEEGGEWVRIGTYNRSGRLAKN